MAEWFVVFFDQLTDDGYKTTKVSAPTDDEAILISGNGFGVAFPVKRSAALSASVHTQAINEYSAFKMLISFDARHGKTKTKISS